MALTKAEVVKIAGLARIQLTDDEIEKYRLELSRILDYFTQLDELDTTNVVPTSQLTGLENQMRADVVNDELDRSILSDLAAEMVEGHVKVPPVFNAKS